MNICTVESCGRPVRSVGLCGAHYKRNLKYGSPLAGGTYKGAPFAWLKGHLDHDGTECLTWPFAVNEHGYAIVSFEGRAQIASRVVCSLVKGPAPTPEHEAAHSCGKGHLACIHPKHVRWATSLENEADKIAHGTYLVGEANHATKISDESVSRMRQLRASGLSLGRIGSEFGVSARTVHRIVTGQSRTHSTLIAAE